MTWQVLILLLSVAVISLAFGYHLGHYNGRSGKCKDKKLMGHKLDGCLYQPKEIWETVTVTVGKCRRCGHEDFSWYKKKNSKQIYKDKEEKTNENQT